MVEEFGEKVHPEATRQKMAYLHARKFRFRVTFLLLSQLVKRDLLKRVQYRLE